jgi:hypothetical protein
MLFASIEMDITRLEASSSNAADPLLAARLHHHVV